MALALLPRDIQYLIRDLYMDFDIARMKYDMLNLEKQLQRSLYISWSMYLALPVGIDPSMFIKRLERKVSPHVNPIYGWTYKVMYGYYIRTLEWHDYYDEPLQGHEQSPKVVVCITAYR